MDFNLKNLEPNDPVALYNKLDKLVRFGDTHATVKGEKDEIQGYYIGGLLVNDIKKSSVSSETINKLYSALKSYDIEHAILPDDIYKGQIPIILDDHTRSYMRKNLKELIEYENLAWRLYFIPINLDVVDDELSHAEIIFEEDGDGEYQYLSLFYSDIDSYLKKLVSDDTDSIDKSYLYKSDNENKAENEDKDQAETNDEQHDVENTDELDEFEFDEEDTNKQQEMNNNVVDTPLENKDQAQQSDKETPSESSEQSNDEVENKETDTNKAQDDENLEIQDEDIASEYTEIPQELQATLDEFYLGRFKEFENLDDKDTTHVILQKEIKNANDVLEVHEKNAKRKAKQLYIQYMSQSYDEINQVIDVENGDDIVKNKHQEMQSRKEDLDIDLQKRIEAHKQELEDRFWNEHFNTFKEQTLAGLALKFEKEEYYNLVAEPLERFEESERNLNQEAKFELTHELSNWFDKIKSQAITKDRNNAIMEVQSFLESSKQEVQAEIKELDTKMTEQNERFIQYEYGKKAEERLRNTVGSDLYTDEQAKKYKKQFEMTEKEKEAATNELKALEAKYKKDMEVKTEEHDKFKKDIEANHKKVLASKDEKLKHLNKDLTEIKSENEKNKTDLDKAKKNTRKKSIGVGVGGFILSALIFGGTALGIHSHDQNVQDKLDSQQKVVKQQKAEASKNKSDLDKLKKDKEEESKKQQKVIDDQKKEIEKQKKDKKDKK